MGVCPNISTTVLVEEEEEEHEDDVEADVAETRGGFEESTGASKKRRWQRSKFGCVEYCESVDSLGTVAGPFVWFASLC